jgi:DivIVA domain-containing protein
MNRPTRASSRSASSPCPRVGVGSEPGDPPRNDKRLRASLSRASVAVWDWSYSRRGDQEDPQEREERGEPAPPPEEGGGLGEIPVRVPAAIRDVSFPGAARGYERRAVDAYVNQVNRLIAELEVSRSPQAAVKHALERVGEQTKALLQQARQTV